MPPSYQTHTTPTFYYGGPGIVAIALAIWVIVDANQRGKSPVEAIGYGIFTLFCCCIGFPVYLMTRSK